jgi:hypothetical protein
MGLHTLKARAPRLLGKHGGRDGRAYRRAYDALLLEYGPFDRPLLRLEAGRVSVAWMNVEIATRALVTARRARERGRGRRPSVQAVERLAKRQGLADASYSQALDKLRELVQANGRGPRPLAELVEHEQHEQHRRSRASAGRPGREPLPAPSDALESGASAAQRDAGGDAGAGR